MQGQCVHVTKNCVPKVAIINNQAGIFKTIQKSKHQQSLENQCTHLLAHNINNNHLGFLEKLPVLAEAQPLEGAASAKSAPSQVCHRSELCRARMAQSDLSHLPLSDPRVTLGPIQIGPGDMQQ
jgi:hypothetical protein